MSQVTLNQFKNILAFTALMSHSKYIHELSPDYIVDKYTRYIGDPTQIKDTVEHHSGLHAVLKREVIDAYFEIWGDDIQKTIIRSDRIKMALHGYTPDKPMTEHEAKILSDLLKDYIDKRKQ
jgi:hypothetical protein